MRLRFSFSFVLCVYFYVIVFRSFLILRHWLLHVWIKTWNRFKKKKKIRIRIQSAGLLRFQVWNLAHPFCPLRLWPGYGFGCDESRKLTLKNTEEKKERVRRSNWSEAAVKEITVNAAVAAVLSELDAFLKLAKQITALKAFPGWKDVFGFIPNWLWQGFSSTQWCITACHEAVTYVKCCLSR